jgi:hypothetical protein
MSCGDIGVISKTNEWSLLERQFDALAHEKSVDPDSIEKIFDMEFRRRFSELINRTRGLSTQNRDIGPHGFYMDLFQKMNRRDQELLDKQSLGPITRRLAAMPRK